MSGDDTKPSPESERFMRLGAAMAEGFAAGIERGARETKGMTWEERVRYLLENTSPETLAHAGLVARRSFPALYEGDGPQAPADDWPPGCRCVLSGGRRMSLGGPCPMHKDVSVAPDEE